MIINHHMACYYLRATKVVVVELAPVKKLLGAANTEFSTSYSVLFFNFSDSDIRIIITRRRFRTRL